MEIRNETRRRRGAAAIYWLITLALQLVLMGPGVALASHSPWPTAHDISRVTSASAVVLDCEGDACAQVTVTWDQEGQRFRAQNDSDRRVKIEVNTFAGSSNVVVPAHEIGYLEVKTFNGPYHANYE